MRPRSLDEMIGQEHVLGAGSALRSAIEGGKPHSAILYGPPGAGKTTLARIAAAGAEGAFEEESAVNAGKAEIRGVIERARERRRASGRPTILFLDEIHRFNKAQQDALLPAVEEGAADPDRGDDREPLLRGQLGPALAGAGLRAAAARAGAGGRAAAAGAGRPRARHRRPARPSPTRRWRCWRRAAAATPGSRSRRWSGRSSVAEGDGRRRRDRGRAAAQGDRLRPPGRSPLRLRLRLDQGDPRLRRRRLALLPGGDARGRRGPALHRPPYGDPRLRGRRQRRSAGAARRRRRRPRGRPRRPARVRAQPRPGGRLPRPGAEVERLPQGALRPPAPRSAPTAPRPRPTTCATPITRAPPRSAAARATATRTTSRAAVSDQPLLPAELRGRRFYEPTDRGFEAGARRSGSRRLRKRFRQCVKQPRNFQVRTGFHRSAFQAKPGRADNPAGGLDWGPPVGLVNKGEERASSGLGSTPSVYPAKAIAYLGPMAADQPQKLRLGGMALRNGLLIHGPTHWAAAVRAKDGDDRGRLRAQARAGAGPGRETAGAARAGETGRGAGGAAAGAPADARGAAAVRGRAGAGRDRGDAGATSLLRRRARDLGAARGDRAGDRRGAGAGRPQRPRPRRLPRGRAQGDRRLRAGESRTSPRCRRSTTAAART